MASMDQRSNPPNRAYLNPLLLVISGMVKGLQQTLGPGSEVLLHNLQEPQRSVIAIAGNLTGRTIGAPATDLLLRLLRTGRTDTNPINYGTQTADGRQLRSSTLFIHDLNENVIGALCINIDVSQGAEIQEWLSSHIAALMTPGLEEEMEESFAGSIEDVVEKAVNEALATLSKPFDKLTKPDRLRIVEMLDQQGVFLVKKSSIAVAEALGISRATLYNDLNQVRSMTGSRVRKEDSSWPE